jgi:hypothetical protein
MPKLLQTQLVAAGVIFRTPDGCLTNIYKLACDRVPRVVKWKPK